MKSVLLHIKTPEYGEHLNNYIPRVGDKIFTGSMVGYYIIIETTNNTIIAMFHCNDEPSIQVSYTYSSWSKCKFGSSGSII